MEQKKCKKCQRILPDGYKHKYCENCQNEQVEHFKNNCKGIASIAIMIAGPVITIATKGKINLTKK